jgi:hypothetical protein
MSTYSIDHSVELMTNYLQAEIMAPEADLQALQTASGAALLLSVGTDAALYVTIETIESRSGWRRSNLSVVEAAKLETAPAACTGFASAQTADGTIQLAMVLRDNDSDHLYLCLDVSASNLTWIDRPGWVAFPYDDPDHPRATVRIEKVFISEATDGQYIVVDVVRDPGSPLALVTRYYIDPEKASGHAWQPHDVAIDLETGAYASCLGRKAGQDAFPVDGIYTSGHVGGKSQLVYAPLYNVFDPAIPPDPDVLQLPGGVIPDAIAACRNADNTSDLYVAAAGALYHFAGRNQDNNAIGVQVVRNDLFNGVRRLFAFLDDGDKVLVWGLNAADQIFYTACPRDRVHEPSAWIVPVPILSSVEQVTPFLNREYSANSFFAHTGTGELVKGMKSPGTSMWTFSRITLPPTTTRDKARPFSSYTTRIQVSDAKGKPAGNVEVRLSASTISPLFINHLYYVIGDTPVTITTDPLGAVTVVQAVETLTGAKLTVSVGDATVTINPMDAPLGKISKLTSADDLKAARIRDMDGGSRPLVSPDAPQPDLDALVASNKQLAQAYSGLRADAPVVGASLHKALAVDGLDATLVDVGDLFAWLGHEIVTGVDRVVRFIETGVKGIWAIVVEIAGKVYRAVLDTVEAIAAAATWLFNAIKTSVKDLIAFLSFLFNPAALQRTKDVIKNVVTRFLDYQVNQIGVLRKTIDQTIEGAERAIDGWAGLEPWSGLGSDAVASVDSRATSSGPSAPGSMLSHHFQGNAGNWSYTTPVDPPGASLAALDALTQALAREGEAVEAMIARLRDLGKDLTSMPLEDVLKKLVAIVADFGLESVRNVSDAVLDVIAAFARMALDLLDTPIHIPVLSDILEGFGVPKFSILDIVCWIVAVPVNLIHDLIRGQEPFPDTETTRFLATAADFEDVDAAFRPSVRSPRKVGVAGVPAMTGSTAAVAVGTDRAARGLVSMPADTARIVFTSLTYAAAMTALMSVIVSSIEAEAESGDNPMAVPSGGIALVGAVCGGVATVLVPYDALEDPTASNLGKGSTGLRILNKAVFTGAGQAILKTFNTKLSKLLTMGDSRAVGAVVDAMLVITDLIPMVSHFMELGRKPADETRAIAIVGETANITSFISRVSYAVAVCSQAEVKYAAIGVGAGANLCSGGLLLAESFIQPNRT